LLSTNKFDVNYAYDSNEEYLGHRLVSYRSGNKQTDKGYLLKCIQILYHYGYGFIDNKDKDKGNNVLHHAAELGDIGAIEVVMNIFQEEKEKKTQILNSKNNENKMPMHIAMDSGNMGIVNCFLDYEEQQFEVDEFMHRDKKGNYDTMWTNCFAQMCANSDILDRLDVDTKKELLDQLLQSKKSYNKSKDIMGSHNEDHENRTPLSVSRSTKSIKNIMSKSPNTPSEPHGLTSYYEDIVKFQNIDEIVTYLHKDLGIPVLNRNKAAAKPADTFLVLTPNSAGFRTPNSDGSI